MHYLPYGSSKLDSDRIRCSVGFTEFSQTEAAILENNHKPLPTREDGEEVHRFFNCDLSDSSRWGVMVAPETVKAGLANRLLA